ncbi:MAG TPA: restriction endonuclease subunit S [Thiopseudomonas sp.]|nr:restriction endonuclease subunit S [Thiopseudomonas sp.]
MTGRYKAYPEYKDSGVEWLGEIPSHWDSWKLKHCLKSALQYGANEAALDDDKNDPRYIRITDMNEDGTLRVDTFKSLPLLTAKDYLLSDGDILLARSGATVGKSFLYKDSFGISCFAGYLIKASCENKILIPSYAYWFFQSDQFWKYISGSQIQSTIQNVSAEKYGEMKLSFSECIQEQQQITDFLDHETAKIDTLITKQEQLIELLKEKRQAVISHAVTKGLNPDAPMKDSGVEWLGQVPEHWEVAPLKYLCTFSGGGTPSKENLSYWTDGTIPWVSPKDMKIFRITKTQDYITEKALLESSTNLVAEGALLMVVRSGILQRNIPIAINDVKVTLNQDMKALRFNKRIDVEYAANFILGNVAALLLDWSKEGATVESIEHEYLSNGQIAVPPLDEQQTIIFELEKSNQYFDQLEMKATAGIELLKERKTALISAAVTGKIDVRDWHISTVENGATVQIS